MLAAVLHGTGTTYACIRLFTESRGYWNDLDQQSSLEPVRIHPIHTAVKVERILLVPEAMAVRLSFAKRLERLVVKGKEAMINGDGPEACRSCSCSGPLGVIDQRSREQLSGADRGTLGSQRSSSPLATE
jgi:hypothetical protein